jgi:hypothetical protein
MSQKGSLHWHIILERRIWREWLVDSLNYELLTPSTNIYRFDFLPTFNTCLIQNKIYNYYVF